ncbi:MAG: hypothetical protein IJK52_05800 [Oscillospiraceae bacterium]|nr:hypothetical protein [Oscillospiraceae bacterium]
MTNVNIALDDGVAQKLEALCYDMSMDVQDLFSFYAQSVVKNPKLAYRVSASVDPFYSEENLASLARAVQQEKEGKFVVKTMEELEAMARE